MHSGIDLFPHDTCGAEVSPHNLCSSTVSAVCLDIKQPATNQTGRVSANSLVRFAGFFSVLVNFQLVRMGKQQHPVETGKPLQSGLNGFRAVEKDISTPWKVCHQFIIEREIWEWFQTRFDHLTTHLLESFSDGFKWCNLQSSDVFSRPASAHALHYRPSARPARCGPHTKPGDTRLLMGGKWAFYSAGVLLCCQ